MPHLTAAQCIHQKHQEVPVFGSTKCLNLFEQIHVLCAVSESLTDNSRTVIATSNIIRLSANYLDHGDDESWLGLRTKRAHVVENSFD